MARRLCQSNFMVVVSNPNPVRVFNSDRVIHKINLSLQQIKDMNNNDIFKKLRVALQLRDDQIAEIMQLVDFRISKAELGAFFRAEDHPNYMECGDQVLRNFLNGLIIHLRGTKENPKNAMDVINENRAQLKSVAKKIVPKENVKKPAPKAPGKNFKPKKVESKVNPVEKVRFNNGKNKKA